MVQCSNKTVSCCFNLSILPVTLSKTVPGLNQFRIHLDSFRKSILSHRIIVRHYIQSFSSQKQTLCCFFTTGWNDLSYDLAAAMQTKWSLWICLLKTFYKSCYSQTRSSVPVANELMNSFTEKWFRLLIQ